jgi:hypothetical protein
MTGVVIRGDGVAARCCAHLLARSGVPVSFQPTDRPRLPAIMLSEPAQALIREIFGRENLFRDLPRIRKRIVAWGRSAGAVELEHSGVVVSEQLLLDSLGTALPDAAAGVDIEVDIGSDIGWTVFASMPLPAAAVEHRFGSRIATAVQVELKPTAEPAACWIESIEDGWLFLIANAPGSGWLLSVGLRPHELLDQSRLIRKQIAGCQPADAQFAASPRIVAPLGEPGWIACGTAAMAFDPLCGDGTAHAVREAILASAVIGAAARGDDPIQLMAHYEARLTAGFRRHLAHCLEYYASGCGGPWWQSEAESVRQGLDWCGRQLSRHTAFRYRLDGFELRAIG